MRPLLRIKAGLLAFVLLVAVLIIGCGGGDDSASADGGGSIDERLARLEESVNIINQYIGSHTQMHAEGGVQQAGGTEVSANGVVQPTYTLNRDAASENEQEFVRWIADCSVRNYLNPDLPPAIINREIEKTESEMWDSLESGQHISFEAFVGMAFSFCQLKIVEPEEDN